MKPFKPRLMICDYDMYRGFYCGLCKTLGKNFGFASRMLLSYDFVFLGMLEYAMTDNKCTFENQTCVAHPLKKRPCLCCKDRDMLKFTACCECILVYNKYRDDFCDNKGIKKIAAWIICRAMKKSYRKAYVLYPELAEYVEKCMKKQLETERSGTESIDDASEPSSMILSEIASYLSDDAEQKKYLKRFGYLLGRYIYIADAYNDYEHDLKSGSYNPYMNMDKEQSENAAKFSVNITLGALADVYVHLDIRQFKTILDNIVYMGLRNNFNGIVSGKKQKGKE